MTIHQHTEITGILQQYQIKFINDNILQIESDQNLSIIPSEEIIKILGLRQDNGHQIFIEKLSEIENEWLNIFLKYEKYYDVYNNIGEINLDSFFNLLHEIIDGLK
ncbi:hypothetical protein HNP37_004468 [Flavobacterium nitrogenifigens]|uniref:Uncharacterized protein n=2 Tax=Flavobacterium TaxID=237 RepID=A0A7W7J179_9FLAO|nr:MULTISPECIES: hypothetical protein [Flavobacterium]MBB4804381.1 hypothetical protein [Flavobacterium nitrogenifigens]MBB6389223.1 hypothetical protein [Flavobacterium notoginsengisoli]